MPARSHPSAVRPRTILARLLLAGIVASAAAPAVPASAPARDPQAFVDALLARMTLEEKLGQLNQPPAVGSDTGPAAQAASAAQVRDGQVGSFLGMAGARETCAMQKVAVEQSRLHIPLLFAFDVIHGYRTIFPQPLGEAASFDPGLAERTARIAAVEASADGIQWTFAPMVDIARDPRWGRISEGAGEDVFLGEAFAAARVRGFQGKDLAAPDTVLATAKHFVAYGAAQAGRDYNSTDMSERTLREVYLPPFKAAIDAGAGSVMAAFNALDGVPMHANRPLIDGVLRKQLGFDGIVVSDYTGIMELMPHGVAANPTEAGILGLHAGVDIDMVSDIYRKELPAAVRAGRVPEAEVDAAVRRVLLAKLRLGLFDDPYRYCGHGREATDILTPAHRQAAREAARASMVLLRNEGGVLPLGKSLRTLAVIGPLADDGGTMIGNWAGRGRLQDAVTPLQGLREALGDGVRVLHARGAEATGGDRSGFDAAVRMARQADAVVLVLGEPADMSGEAASRTELGLPGVQEALAEAIAATGKPVVAVLLNGRPLALERLAATVPAILEAWYPGSEGGRAIADVLLGDYNPAGRLPATFPRNVGQVPIHYDHLATGRPPNAAEKYTSKYLDVPWTPLYPFGFGLSYTDFRYSDLRVSTPRMAGDGEQVVQVSVTNTGKREGDEVVQLYLRDDVASVAQPVRRLRGFQRVHLQAGEARTLRFVLRPRDLAMLDASMRLVVEPGRFSVFVGGSSDASLQAAFEVTAAHALEP